MNKKPKILAFNKFYLPGYRAGGPIRTLANMVDRLSDEFDFHIVTLDRDACSSEPYSGIVCGEWIKVGKGLVMYLDPATLSLRQVADIVLKTAPDLIYLNSFFDPTFTQRILWARRFGQLGKIPVVLAPRGEFSDGALRLKRWKKHFYLYLCNFTRLHHGLIWQASSNYEQADILRHLSFVSGASIREAMDLAPINDQKPMQRTVRKVGDPLRVCFLSRISPMKNLDFALRVLAIVRSPLVFSIYGPVHEHDYWISCQKLITDLPSHINVKIHGGVEPERVPEIMANHDLFFLPTLGENYGHVIAEALSSGTPVLIANTTPWRDLQQAGVGWDLPLGTEKPFAECIEYCANLDDHSYRDWRVRVHSFVAKRLSDNSIIEANRSIFFSAIVQ